MAVVYADIIAAYRQISSTVNIVISVIIIVVIITIIFFLFFII